MAKLTALLLSLVFMAASCNLDFTAGNRGVFRSEDGGESFHQFNNTEQKADGLSGTSINSLVFDPNNSEIIYLASASGIHKTDNGQFWRYILTGMAVADLALDSRQADTVYAAGVSGNNGKIIKSTDGGKNWSDMYTEPTKSNAVLSVAVNGSLVIAGLSTGEIIRSFDSGNTWQIGKDLQDRIVKLRFTSSTGVIYALTQTKGLFKSTDSGNTWTLISSPLSTSSLFNSQSAISNVSVFHDFSLDQKQIGVIYLATEEGLFRTVNDGTAWNILSLPLKNSALKASAVAVNPANSNNVFVAIGFTIFKSLNGAITWETKELTTEQQVRVLLIDPRSTNIVYLGLGESK